MAAFGLTAKDFADEDTVHVWAENWPAVQLFIDLGTQWRVGPGGFVGLDYNVLFRFIERMDLPPEKAREMEDDVRVMERAALKELNRE